MNAQRRLLLYNVEAIITNFLANLTGAKAAVVVDQQCNVEALQRVSFNDARRRHRIALVLYVLGEIHRLLLTNDTCTPRELYYKQPDLCRSQRAVDSAVKDVCNIFGTMPWNLGIFASGKGLVAGPLRIHTTSGDIIDCNAAKDVILLPKMVNAIERLEVTTARLVLVVEKDTVFQKLLAQIALDGNALNIICITGKGFPDLTTRALVRRLHMECALPVYILVDADPYGIEILHIYRNGSAAMAHSVDRLACPQIGWLGVHPSELDAMHIPTIAFTGRDHSKVLALQRSPHLTSSTRSELCLLQRMQRKSRIEQLPAHALLHDYVVNKIKRNLAL